MWISELSSRSDVPVATIKYYLREGLLPPGIQVSATRASYDGAHVRQLRLIRALAQTGGLSLARVRAVLAAVQDDTLSLHEMLGAAHRALVPPADATAPSRRRVDRLLADRRWRVDPDSPDRDRLAAALDAIEQVGHSFADDLLSAYADAAEGVAEVEIDGLPTDDRAAAVETTVVFTALGGPVLLALRRLAEQSASARRYG